MQKASNIQLNRYKGLDNSKVLIVSEEIATLKLLEKLNLEKENITKFNKANHIKIKGFSANFHNFNRSENSYSIAEDLFRRVLEDHNINSYLHEYQIKVKDVIGKNHTYHLDFYLPSIKLAIEISPLFHFTYETVAIRDQLRTSLLKRKVGIETQVVKVHFRTVKSKTETYLNPKDVNQIISIIKRKLRNKPHKETLARYL